MSDLPDQISDRRRAATLDALSILDTPAESAFDDIVEVVAALCDVPIALVSLVADDRQWFKARIGIDLTETPIEQSVCALAIRQDDMLVIEDMAGDARTAANPLVTAADGIRFYAGVPLVLREGTAIGSLCAIDTAPRPGGLTARQASAMRALARQVVEALEARRMTGEQSIVIERARRGAIVAGERLEDSEARSDAFARSDTRSRSAQEAARIGTFELDTVSGIAQVSAEFCRLFGLPVQPTLRFADVERLMIDDAAIPRSTVASRADGTAALDVEYRVRRADDGQVRWIARRAAFERGGAGRAARMRGTIHDVTDRRVAGERIEALLTLGDRVRDLTNIGEIAAAGAEALCSALHAARCGYASIDLAEGAFKVEHDCIAGDMRSIVGRYPVATFAATIDDLRAGRIHAHADTGREPALAAEVDAYRSIEARAQIVVPLIDHNELKGALFVHERVPRSWSAAEIGFVQSVADRTYAAIAKVRAEEERQLLSQELSHRLKNLLAMIQAIAANTLRKVAEREPVEAFNQRLMALSAAHDVLLRQNWSAARIDLVVAGVLDHLGVTARVTASGPPMTIGARGVLGVSLLIHELATNAIKHGALSVVDGEVSLTWRTEAGDGDARFHLDWRERGGPEAHVPTAKGFGSRLISMGLAGTGGAELRYRPTGLEADFVAPLARMRTER